MQNPYLALLKTAWNYASNKRKRFVIVYAMFVISNIIVAMNPLFYGWFINELQHHGMSALSTGWIYVGGFLGLRLLEWAFHGPARVMERKLAFHVSKNYLEDLYVKVLHLPMQWHQENHSGATISKLRKAHEALRDFFQQGFIYLYSFGKFAFSFLAMLYFSPLFGSIGVLLGVITILIIIRFDKPYIRSLHEVNARENEVSSTLFDSLSNILTVITLRLEKSIQEGFMSKLVAVYSPFKKNAVINEWKWFVAQMMVGLIYAVITIGYIFQNTNTDAPFMIGGLVILLGYVNQFTSVFNDIASQYTQITKFHTDIQNAKDIEVAAAQHPTVVHENKLPAYWKKIDINGLNFVRPTKLETDRKTGLKDLGLEIHKGKRVALIGESGSGKSTLLSLLRGLHQTTESPSVMINDLMPINLSDIETAVTLFPQEPEIFENTVLYNITLGASFTEEEVMHVCNIAQFSDVVRQLPQGLNTFLHEKGANLSGGQKQRLAIARGILAARKSDIILMDEPTSSVDPKTEKMLYQTLFDQFQDKAVISSLHRLHLLTQFDYVYILKDGSVIDEGTFEDLKRYSLVFKEMWQHQAPQEETASTEEFPQLNVAL